MTRTPCIKGIVFREFVRWYEQSHGREAALRAFRSLPLELAAQVDPDRECFGLLPSSWYPVELATTMLEAITWGLGLEARATMLRRGVEHAIGVTLTGVHRVLFRTLITPERHARYAQKIWSNYYNTGEVRGRVLAPGRAEQLVTDWNGHHPLLCEMSIFSLTAFHEHMGCRGVKVSRSRCVLDGRIGSGGAPPSSRPSPGASEPSPTGGACRFLITWEAAR